MVSLPTLTTLVGAPPAKFVVTPPTVPVGVGFGAAVVEPLPSATSLALFATAFGPIATESVPSAWLSAAVDFAWKYLMPWLLILSITEPTLLAVDVVPSALYVVYDGADTVPVAGLYVAPPPSAAAVLLPRLSVFADIVLRPVDSELAVVDVEVDSEATPVEVEVDNDVTLDTVVLATA